MKSNYIQSYIVAAVLVVAIVGVLSLLMTGSSNDLTGQAIGDPLCTDTDGGLTYTMQGTITGGTWKTTAKPYKDYTDSCVTKGKKAGMLLEGFCPDSTHGFYNYVDCTIKVGADYRCINGACVLDSDGDGVADTEDVCPGYDDTIDTDSDGTPDGCDSVSDSDGDGVPDDDDICDGYNDTVDTDSDGTPDGCDDDDDGDGYSDADETNAGTDWLDASDYPVDTDSDGVLDADDACEGYDDAVDTDSDGTPDGCDSDDDGDGYSDADEVSAGTDSLDRADYPMPDLVPDSSSTTVSLFPGTVYVFLSNTSIVSSNVSANFTLGISNQGTATASAVTSGNNYKYTYSSLSLIYGARSGGASTWSDSSFTLAPLGSRTYTTKASYSYIPDSLLYELYTSGTATATLKAAVDYYTYYSASGSRTYTYGINESDETNNNGTSTVSLTSSGITFIEAECANDLDCGSGCGCNRQYDADYNSALSKYACYQYAGGSTYITTTEC